MSVVLSVLAPVLNIKISKQRNFAPFLLKRQLKIICSYETLYNELVFKLGSLCKHVRLWIIAYHIHPVRPPAECLTFACTDRKAHVLHRCAILKCIDVRGKERVKPFSSRYIPDKVRKNPTHFFTYSTNKLVFLRVANFRSGHA